MEQMEENKSSSNKSGEVSAAIAKSPENRERTILPSLNGGTTGSEAPCAKTGCWRINLNGVELILMSMLLVELWYVFRAWGIEKEFAQAAGREEIIEPREKYYNSREEYSYGF